ncbi:hypothetical protein G9F31_10745 [Acinetobacter sp. 187]|uniref:hypothetical protein n=1 Tax=Acinetobacter lanii TaxID=2715163 RepID=UPI00140C62E0|nr:hypothetical protein [Acinetobacter lanii]NHC04241.1 hypothetical protein [Acinetobacter lanii]
MELIINQYILELDSDYLNTLYYKNCLKINGMILNPKYLMFEFEVLIEEEEIVFDVYYDQKHKFMKIYTDEDYERSFREYFKADQFLDAKIKVI